MDNDYSQIGRIISNRDNMGKVTMQKTANQKGN